MESVGARLKKIRLEKGLSLEEVHKKTKIHPNILKTIEEDSLINLSPIYIKGFLKIYCKFLGVDPRDYIPDYKEPAQSPPKYGSDIQAKTPFFFKGPSLKNFFFKINIKTIFIIILILMISLGLFSLGKIISSKRRFASHKAKVSYVVSERRENKIQITRLENPAALKTIRLDIRAKENCFIQLKTDGRIVFQNILRKGRSESWQATDKIELSLGNAGVVELEVNGKRISNLGRKGQALKNILITKEGLTIKR